MELKSKLSKIEWPENKEYKYKLSGLGGSGELFLFFGALDDNYTVHVKCTAKLPLLSSFHFEGLSTWVRTYSKGGTPEGFDFVSYEEKDFSKNIHKKWEMLADGLNYIENKKGLVLEREVQYFNTPESASKVFDPISAATVALIENPTRDVNIFGKQRILQLKVEKAGDELKIAPFEGLNPTWTKILGNSSIILDQKNHIQEIEIPSPIQIGKIKMNFVSEETVGSDQIQSNISEFRKEN